MSPAKKITHRKNQGGFVLIASMLMLIVLAFMAVAMYHNFTTQENMSSNTKEKGRTFQMAQSTLQYAEYQLMANGWNTASIDCSSATVRPMQNGLTICNESSDNAVSVTQPTSTTPWSIGNANAPLASTQYNPTTEDSSISVTSTTVGQNTFSTYPLYYIQELGNIQAASCPSANSNPATEPRVYQITAIAYGASSSTMAVVQSIYQLTASVCNLQTNSGSP
jgi:type IV pilus assembly protein PilX